jgi:hypothetical protein
MAAENIDNTINGTGLFPAKVPGLSDAADIQAALRLYHYGSYTYDGSNTNPANLLNPSIAKHLQNLKEADAAEIVARNAAITTHNAATTNVHGIANTANLATQQFVATSITTAISGVVGEYSLLAGDAIDWNTVDARFDVEPRLANVGTVITKSANFTLSPDDVGKTIVINSSAPINVFLPENSSVPLPVGYAVDIIQTGSGSVTVSEGSGAVSINSKSSIKSLDGQYSKGTLVKIADNTWFFFGNLLNVVVPTPVPTPVAPTPIPTTPVAPVPVPAVPVAPVAPVEPVAPIPTPITPVAPTAPTLPTPSLSVSSMGPYGFGGGVYANITIGNYDYQNTYTTTTSGLTKNPEYPEEWNFTGLTNGQSYTVYITASRPGSGYADATGSLTFTASTTQTPTPAVVPAVTNYYVSGCCSNSGPGGVPGKVEGSSTVSFANAQDKMDEFCVNGVISDIKQSNIASPEQNCQPAPTPIVGTTYWATGCCEGAYGGYQVTGTSTVNSQTAVNAMNTNCSEPGYGVPDYSTGSYTTTNNIPVNSCSVATPVPVAPVPVPAAPVAPTPVVVVIPGTIYLSYCDVQNGLVNDTVAINAENFISTNINTACASYRSLLEYGGSSSIQCSTAPLQTPSVCGGNPTPVPVPVPVVPVAAQPTPVAPTPVPVVASTTLWHAVCFSDGGATNESSTVPNMLYSDCATYRAFVLSIDPGASINCSSTGPVTSPGCTVAPTPAPVVTYSRNEVLPIATILCETGQANFTVRYTNANFTGKISEEFTSCILPTPTPTPVPAVAPDCNVCNSYSPNANGDYSTRPNSDCPSGNEYYRLCITPGGCANKTQTNGCVPVAAPVPAVDCTTCNTYSPNANGTYAERPNSACPTGNEYWRTCVTPGNCPNIDQTNGCVPPPTPAPTAAVPSPTALDCTACTGYGSLPPTQEENCSDGCGTRTRCNTAVGCANYYLTTCPGCVETPTACVANCVVSSYTCIGMASLTYYNNTGCGGSAACPSTYDQYGCA